LSDVLQPAAKNGAAATVRTWPPMTAIKPTFTEEDALSFHMQGRPGKIEIIATKPLTTQRDLSLAYSPGVAWPCLRIAKDANAA
jgi:malate dehydrogenase (oxaloacetate-decarboxylating)(NADP+)